MPGATAMRSLYALVIVPILGVAFLVSHFAPADEPARRGKAITAEQVTAWIAQLDADQFVTRETATTRLIAAGEIAIDPVAAAVPAGSLEVTLRGIHVLRELALSNEPECQEAARTALERIAAARLTTAAHRAQLTLTSLNETRQARAIDELQRLGVKLTTSQVQFGFQVMENVTAIDIGPEWQGEVKDLRRLKLLNGIQSIRLTGPKVTDEWMPYLSTMENLTFLTIKRTEVTAEGIKHLRDLSRLQVLYVLYSPVGDPATEHLANIRQLTQLKLYGTQISREAANKLSEQLVTTKVDHRQGAFLGVNCQASNLGCEVVLVQPNTAAATAGLNANDVILTYAGQRVDSFEALTAQIAKNKPGDQVKVTLVRDPQEYEVEIVREAVGPIGATLKAHVLGCEIEKVVAGELAERNGLDEGDVIVMLDGQRVTSVDDFQKRFDKLKIDVKVSLEYVRKPRILERTITLGEWD